MFGEFLLRNVRRISLFYSGHHISKRKSDIERPGEEECKPLLQTIDLNKMHTETKKEGTIMHYESSDGSLYIWNSKFEFQKTFIILIFLSNH